MEVAPLETILEMKETTSEKSDKDVVSEEEDVLPVDFDNDNVDNSLCGDQMNKSSSSTSDIVKATVEAERESGDGQESVPSKKVDDDEDRQNPQYIPKKGNFYEHDDRAEENTGIDETEPGKKNVEQLKKNQSREDKKQKWAHDKFDDGDQAPKSRDELVAYYGYDIRNEHGPPKARRRRRYGRGPKKYERNWEDENAYTKAHSTASNTSAQQRKSKIFRKSTSGTPQISGMQMNNSEKRSNANTVKVSRHVEGNAPGVGLSAETTGNGEPNKSPATLKSYQNLSPKHTAGDSENQSMVSCQQKQPEESAPCERFVKTITATTGSGPDVAEYKGFTAATRHYRNTKTEPNTIGTNNSAVTKQRLPFLSTTNRSATASLETQMDHLTLGYPTDNIRPQANNNVHNPRMLVAEQKTTSKRYSSIRQKTFPEASLTPPPPPQSTTLPPPPAPQYSAPPPSAFYPSEYTQQNHMSHQAAPQIPIPQQVPVTAAPLMPAAQFAPPPPHYHQPHPQFLQSAVAPPPQFIPPQTPQIINYVPSQPQFAQGYQGFQQPFNGVNQPETLYQSPPPPPPGITYYSTNHQVSQRAVLPKRPKAAIPIVAPPTNVLVERKRTTANTEETADTSEQQFFFIDSTPATESYNPTS